MKIARSLTVFAAPLLICTLPFTLPLTLSAQETGFLEKFALAENRDEALKELIPGTDDYYYYHALHLQNQGKQDALKTLLDEWTARFQDENARRREILNRQALIRYATDPAGSLAYLRERLGISYNHQRIRPEARPELSTKLDPATISWDAFLAQAMNGTDSFGNITPQGLVALIRSGKTELTIPRRRDLLNRLHRADFPHLVQIISDDLGTKESSGFGEFAIHGKLTLAQLEALLKLRPELLRRESFVNAWAGKLRPAFGEDPVRNPAVRQAWLERLETFTARLSPAFNSLKAHVLYHRLVHDEAQGVYSEDRFLAYIKLPRSWRKADAEKQHVDLNANYEALSGRPAIGNEDGLFRRFLLQVLAKADTAEKYAPYFTEEWLNAVHAEAKLVSGAPDAEKWVSRLNPAAYQALKDRIDLDFDPALREAWAPGDDVSLDLHVKNVSRLLVKVYEINTENVHRTTGAQVNTDLNLDGLTANAEQVHDYQDAPLLRQKRTFTIPELKGKRGVWIIEFIGGGKSSRALIRKGGLRQLARQTSAGTVLSVFDEAMKPVAKPFALLGTRRFDALEDGSILIPFSTTPGEQSVILGDGSGFTSLERVNVAGENYALNAGFHVARESLLPGMTAKLAIRPALLVNGMPTAAETLEKVKLTIQSRTLDGVPASIVQEIEKVKSDAETVIEFAVPERLSDISFTLEAQVKSLVTGQPVMLSAADSLNVNGITLTEQTSDLHLTHADGQFFLEERGRTGEVRPDREVVVTFARPEFQGTITQTFRTDENGTVSLGSLEGVSVINTRTASGVAREFPLDQTRASQPSVVNVKTGETVQLAWAGNSAPQPGDVSVLEMRGGTPVRDASAGASVAGGLVTIKGLGAGEYAVELAPAGTTTLVRVAEGQNVAGHVLSDTLTMELSNPAPLAITGMARAEAVNKDGGKRPVIVFHIGNAAEGTRVHVLASRFVPEFDVFDALGQNHLPQAVTWTTAWRPSLYQNARIIGEEYRYVLDRKGAKQFPGNMLPRPGLLLNPWAISDTQTDRQSAQRGEDAKPMAAEVPPAPAAAAPGNGAFAKRKEAAAAASMSADLSFLAQAGGISFNLTPDKDGNVMIDASALGDRQFIRVLAVDSDSAIVRDFPLPAQQLVLQDLRLAGGLNPKEHYSRQNRTTLLEKDVPFVFKDALTATWESIGSLGAAHGLLMTLSKDATLAEFAWILNWPGLKPEQRSELYSKYACHELSFFLSRKDPEFFNAVIRPYLANKRDKTFMDHYLLGADLSGYLRPWEYGRLNTVERILLARKIEGEQTAVQRFLKDWLDTLPKDPVRDGMLFETALNGRTLLSDDSGAMAAEWAGVVDGKEDSVAGRRMITIRPEMPKPLFAGTPLPNARFATGAANAPTGGVAVDKFADMESRDSLSVLDGAKLSEESAELESLKKQLSDAPRDERRRGGAMREKAGKDVQLRGLMEAKQERLFRQVEKTREWAENNYYRLLIAQQTSDLVQPDRFWQDFALWDGKSPFVSVNLPDAAGSFAEMMMALAVTDLPFPSQTEKGKVERKDNTVTLTPGGRGVLFHQEIRAAEVDKEGTPLLVSQNFYRQGDRYIEQAGEKTDKFVSGEFLAGVVYGCQVVVTNPSSSRQKLDLLFQIPEGSMPVLNTQVTKSQPVVLEPYHTGTYDFHFYFPVAGDYQHYPVHLSRNAKVAASAQPFSFHVVAKPTQADKASWEYVSQNAEPNEVISFLEQNNVLTLNLDLMAWRLHDGDFAKKALDLLRKRHVWHPTTWSYALQHDISPAVTDYLMHSDAFLAQCGAWLDTPVVKIDPVARWTYQHLEYSPLVNARAHQLGARRTILNDKLAGQFGSLVKILSYRPALESEDHLAVTYYLALQDRIEEAISRFARVDAARIAEKLQYDYLQAWLALSQEDVATARRIAAVHAAHPVDKWRQKFTELASQLDEIDGKAPAKAPEDDRDATQDRLAAQAPAVNVKIENRTVAVNFRNLTEVTVNYYPMDLEFLFSANPFVTQDTSQFRMIRPNRSEKIALPPGKDLHSFPLPAEYQSANVLVEVTGGGITRSEAAYANELDVQISENFGQLQVRHAADKRALSKVYVKVFADQNGTPVFYKDGYTDLRGKFDYASLSTGDLDAATRFSILIMSEKHGATVKEVQPPKR